ncbi:hypothetical protein PR048_027775 [Dryococelus australis]|uniref:Uncharacterized protein n=1 Tax=Dryococelus australis TaxID=614101 RepID=A0ABQ9GHH0_9NEOP|nr:hypothetical protein PR048_027775 [Dryococelus australis]
MQSEKPQIHLLHTAASHQIYKLFEFENTVLKELAVLHPKCVSKKKLPSITHLASKFPATEDRLQSLDMEWRLLRNHKLDYDEDVCAE